MIRSDFKNLKRLQMSFTSGRIKSNIETEMRTLIENQAQLALKYTKENTPVRTGLLKSRWKLTKLTKSRNGLQMGLYNSVYFAKHVEWLHPKFVGVDSERGIGRHALLRGTNLAKEQSSEISKYVIFNALRKGLK